MEKGKCNKCGSPTSVRNIKMGVYIWKQTSSEFVHMCEHTPLDHTKDGALAPSAHAHARARGVGSGL